MKFIDGTQEVAFHLERPNITMKDDKPYFVSAAYGIYGVPIASSGNSQFDTLKTSMTLIIPLKRD